MMTNWPLDAALGGEMAAFDDCFCLFMLGNDLARVLHWGPGYHGEAEPLSLLRDVIDAEEIKLDRYGLNVPATGVWQLA